MILKVEREFSSAAVMLPGVPVHVAWSIDSDRAHAAVNEQFRADDEWGFIGGEEHNGIGDFEGICEPAGRNLSLNGICDCLELIS